MKRNYQQEYIEYSVNFRKSNNSEESISKLYDLLYELEKVEKTDNNKRILTNIYSLLGYYQSAYDLCKTFIDLDDRKQFKKNYTLEQKAKSHGNNFIIKDIRKLRVENKQSELLPKDFSIDPKNQNTFITQKEIVIFNKKMEQDKFKLYIDENNKFENFSTKIIEYINWLSNTKNQLIEFYNSELGKYTNDIANQDWFDTLEIYRTTIILGKNGKLFAEISGGDSFMSDHILDIETEGKEIIEMRYDG